VVQIGNWRSVLIDGIATGTTVPAGAFLVWMRGLSQAVGSLTVRNVKASINAGYLVRLEANTTVTSLLLDGAYISASGAGVAAVSLVAGTTTECQIANVYQNAGAYILAVNTGGTTLGRAVLTNVSAKSIGRIAYFAVPSDLTLTNITVDSPAAEIVYVDLGAAVSIRGAGVNRVTAWNGLALGSGSPAVHVINPDFPVDLSLLAKTNGDIANNTNAGLACGVGKAISNGTNWKNIYSGAVY
jgi:hypothetical protein